MSITVQTTYTTGFARGFPGMIANGEKSNRISRTVEDSAGIAFGKACFRGAADHGCTATPAAGTFMGIAAADIGVVVLPGGTADVYQQYQTAGLLNEGVVFVTVGANVTQGDAAYVTSAGVFTGSSSGNTAIPAVFDETVSSGGVCRLRVRRS